MKFVGGTWWELQLAEGWRAHDHPECLTLTKSNDGAFQLSAATKRSGPVLQSEIEVQSRKGMPASVHSVPFSAGEFSGFCVGYGEGEHHWQRFWLACANVLVFATYNGLHEAWRSEQPSVYAMLHTLRLRQPANVLPV
ncbi:MAG TPA: hypothetical protein PK050_17690 [Hyphomonadaceae bacterium]|nr:hypothetical protein [Hyphomonadaceae bacterium]